MESMRRELDLVVSVVVVVGFPLLEDIYIFFLFFFLRSADEKKNKKKYQKKTRPSRSPS